MIILYIVYHVQWVIPYIDWNGIDWIHKLILFMRNLHILPASNLKHYNIGIVFAEIRSIQMLSFLQVTGGKVTNGSILWFIRQYNEVLLLHEVYSLTMVCRPPSFLSWR